MFDFLFLAEQFVSVSVGLGRWLVGVNGLVKVGVFERLFGLIRDVFDFEYLKEQNEKGAHNDEHSADYAQPIGQYVEEKKLQYEREEDVYGFGDGNFGRVLVLET